jgi:hypothetical protein
MSSSELVRWGAISFMVGGAVWVLVGLLDVIRSPLAPPGPVALVLLIVGLVLSALGLVGLHALQGGSYGRIGLAGLYTALGAIAAQVLGAAVLLAGSAALGWLISPVGLLAKLVGFVLYGAATVQGRVLARWYGVLLIIVMPVFLLLGAYGNIWLGLVLMVLGYGLWMQRGTSVERAPRVR